jgi:hypothetical protein
MSIKEKAGINVLFLAINKGLELKRYTLTENKFRNYTEYDFEYSGYMFRVQVFFMGREELGYSIHCDLGEGFGEGKFRYTGPLIRCPYSYSMFVHGWLVKKHSQKNAKALVGDINYSFAKVAAAWDIIPDGYKEGELGPIATL